MLRIEGKYEHTRRVARFGLFIPIIVEKISASILENLIKVRLRQKSGFLENVYSHLERIRIIESLYLDLLLAVFVLLCGMLLCGMVTWMRFL